MWWNKGIVKTFNQRKVAETKRDIPMEKDASEKNEYSNFERL